METTKTKAICNKQKIAPITTETDYLVIVDMRHKICSSRENAPLYNNAHLLLNIRR